MPDTPAPLSGANTPAPHRSFWLGIFIFLAVVGLAATAFWLADGPNRYHASQEMRAGRVALLASDLPKALGHFRAAAILRPTDEAITLQYDQTQSRWVAMVEQQLQKLAPIAAYLAWQKLPATDGELVEPHAGRYREIRMRVEGGVRAVAEQSLADARTAWEGHDFAQAYELLRELEPLAPLLPEVPKHLKEAQAAELEQVLAAARDTMQLGDFEGARAALKMVAAIGAGDAGYQRMGPAIDAAEVAQAVEVARDAIANENFDAARVALKSVATLGTNDAEYQKMGATVDAAEVTHALGAARAAIAADRFDDARATLKSVAALAAENEEFRKLGPTIDEAEVRFGLKAAELAFSEHQFEIARQRLEQAAATGLLPAEVKAAQAAFDRDIGPALGWIIGRAILEGDDGKVTEAIEQGRRYAGWNEIAAPQLLAPADLPSFLQALDRLGLGPESQAEVIDRADVRLVLAVAARNRLPAIAANDHLKNALVAASRRAREQHLPGLAIFLHDQARMRRAAPDHPWRTETMKEAVESTGVTVAVAEPDKDAMAPAELPALATTRVREALRAQLGAWPRLVAADRADSGTLTLYGEYIPFEYVEEKPVVRTDAVRYRSGTKRIANQERNRLVERYNSILPERDALVRSINQNQATVNEVHDTYGSGNAESAGAAGALVLQRHRLSKLDAQLDDLDAEIDGLPEYLDEAAYASETYKIVDHQYRATMGWRLVTEIDDEPLLVAEWTADTHREIREIVGNANRGVPVQAEAPFPENDVKTGLVGMVVMNAADVSEILERLPALTAQLFEVRYAKTADVFKKADRYLALCYAWEWAGHKLEEQPKIEQSAEALFGLAH